MKKPSLKETTVRQLRDKEKFVHTKDGNKTPKGMPRGSRNEGMASFSNEINIKKTSSYLPWNLWVKYKTYELSQVKHGKRTSLNGLVVELLEGFFNRENI